MPVGKDCSVGWLTPYPIRWSTLIGVFAILMAITAGLHLIPRWGLHIESDVQWIFRLQVVDNPNIAQAIPVGLRALGATPGGLFDGCVAFYETFGRWNCLDHLAFRLMAWAFDGNASLWQLTYVVNSTASLVLLYLILRTVGTPLPLILFLLAGFLLKPDLFWFWYRSSEPRALFFLLLALLVALRRPILGGQAVAAIFMVIAVLLKEPMALAWPVVLGGAIAAYLATSEQRPVTFRSVLPLVLPHVGGAVVIALYRLAFAASFDVQLSYAFSGFGNLPATWPFIENTLGALAPSLLQGAIVGPLLVAIAFVGVSAFVFRPVRQALARQASDPSLWLFLSGLLAAVVLHVMLHYLTGRELSIREVHIVPANFLVAIGVGLIGGLIARCFTGALSVALTLVLLGAVAYFATRSFFGHDLLREASLAFAVGFLFLGLLIYRPAGRFGWQGALTLALSGMLIVPQLDQHLLRVGGERVDMAGWQTFIDDVAKAAPPDGHVVLRFAELGMVETAWALEAETLLAGRTDLTYHFEMEDPAVLEKSNYLLRFTFDLTNRDRAPLPEKDDSIITVMANREGGRRSRRPEMSNSKWIALMYSDPGAFFRRRYVAGRMPYLDYRLERGRKSPS